MGGRAHKIIFIGHMYYLNVQLFLINAHGGMQCSATPKGRSFAQTLLHGSVLGFKEGCGNQTNPTLTLTLKQYGSQYVVLLSIVCGEMCCFGVFHSVFLETSIPCFSHY